MPLYAIGLNHRTAPIEVRERVAFPLDAQRPALEALKTETAADEIAMVSTCNRTEIYVRAVNGAAVERAGEWLAAQSPSDIFIGSGRLGLRRFAVGLERAGFVNRNARRARPT